MNCVNNVINKIGQFLPSPEQLPKVELDVFGISPSIYIYIYIYIYDVHLKAITILEEEH